MRFLNAKAQIALGQVSIIISLMLIANFIGITPDHKGPIREGRAALAESIAANSSALITQKDLKRLEKILDLVVQRNPELMSAGLRMRNGHLVANVGEHNQNWKPKSAEYSVDTHVIVPIKTSTSQWGQIELRFKPIGGVGNMGYFTDPLLHMISFVAWLSFIFFYFYLGKMLKNLDPSQVIPGRVRSALDTMAEGLLVLDSRGQIVLANRAFAILLKSEPEKLMGRKVKDFPWIDSDNNKIKVNDLPWSRALYSGEAEKNVRIRLLVDKTNRLTFMLNCSPILGSGGKNAGVLVSFDDVTQLEETEIELLKSKEEAVAASQAKSAFLANMSHEIRTPMNAILGFTDILKKEQGKYNTGESLKHLEIIQSSGKHLLDLINDILDLSKIEAGQMEMECIKFNPYPVIQDVINVLSVKAKESNIDLFFDLDEKMPEFIFGDPGRLRQIVTNIVGNAIKFTEDGFVKLYAYTVVKEDELVFHLDIADSGVGMSPEACARVFEDFSQADESITRKFGGTGLGLSISKKFAKALGGDITVDSQLGVGSIFKVTIKAGKINDIRWITADEALSATEDEIELKEVNWKFKPANILVVDDGVDNRELIKIVLDNYGLRIDEAVNGKEAIDKVSNSFYDVILMDVQMDEMDGFTAVGIMREMGIKTPVIALTANAMKGFKQECLDAGYSDYFSKPIDINKFTNMMAKLLNAKQLNQNSEEKVIKTPEKPKVEQIIYKSNDGIVSKLDTSNQRFSDLVNRFVYRLQTQIEAMHGSYLRQDLKELADLGHWLKGAGGTVGFDCFNKVAGELETAANNNSLDIIELKLQEICNLAERVAIGHNVTICLEFDDLYKPVNPNFLKENQKDLPNTDNSRI